MEDFDVALGIDASEQGIFTYPEATPDLSGPERLVAQVRETVAGVVKDGKIPVILGGEHTLSIGAVRACAERFDDLSVLFMDAHGDLRDSYMGTRWSHASVARRISETSGIVEVGVRSISKEEHDYARANQLSIFYWPPAGGDFGALVESVCQKLSHKVYVSIDLDVLDPSIMPSVGTPEPGGLGWREATALLAAVARHSEVIGFDLVELSPEEGPVASAATAARLAYRLMGYIVSGCKQ